MSELERAFYEYASQAVKSNDGYAMSARITGYSGDKLLNVINEFEYHGWVGKAEKIGQDYLRAKLTNEGYEKYFELENRNQAHE